jgi:hypothetical protein
MDHKQQSQLIGYAIVGAIIILVLGFRMRRMMQSRPYNLRRSWILPAMLIVLTVSALSQNPPIGAQWLWVIGSFALGAGLGWLRAKTIHLAFDRTSGQVMAKGSPLAMIFLLAIFAVRFALRGVLMAQSSALGMTVSLVDAAFMAMACGLFAARAVEMGLRARVLSGAPAPT